MMKKYLFFFAAFALLVVGCAQNEVVENRSESNAIAFRNLNDKITRIANFNESDYGVFANWTKTGVSEWYMANAQVGGTSNDYSPKQYWPHSDAVEFYAYAPHTAKSSNVTLTTSAHPTLNVKYVVPGGTEGEKPVAHEDFTIATPKKVTIDSSTKKPDADDLTAGGKANLQFNHMLSKITVGAALNNAEGQELTNLGYTLDLSGASVWLEVEKSEGTGSLISIADLTAGGAKAAYENKFADSGATKPFFFIIPQDTYSSGASKATIQIKGVKINYEGTEYWSGNLKAYPIENNKIGDNKFKRNTHYAINFTISNGAADGGNAPVFGDAIEFEATIAADWGSDGDVGVNQPDVTP